MSGGNLTASKFALEDQETIKRHLEIEECCWWIILTKRVQYPLML